MKPAMSLLGSMKEAVVGHAMRLVSDPRLAKVASNPRVMNAAMKALSLGGSMKAEIDKATRLAASVFGIATQEEVASLRATIHNLEDTGPVLEAKAAGGAQPPPPG